MDYIKNYIEGRNGRKAAMFVLFIYGIQGTIQLLNTRFGQTINLSLNNWIIPGINVSLIAILGPFALLFAYSIYRNKI